MKNTKKEVWFITGLGRSGSTLLSLLLSYNDGFIAIGEISALYHPYKAHHRKPECSCLNKNCTIWNHAATTGVEFYKGLFDSGYKVIVDSSKDLLWIYETIRELNDNAISYRILWVRKPFDLFRISHKKRGIGLWKTIWYNISFSIRLNGMSSIYERVEYLDIVNNREIKLKNFYQKVQDEYLEIPESYHGIFGSNSVRNKVDKGIEIIPTKNINITTIDLLTLRITSGLLTSTIFKIWIAYSKFKRGGYGAV